MNEMIERVAMAIEIEVDKLADIDNIGGFYDKMAKAAIEAMREPTDEMVIEGWTELPSHDTIKNDIKKLFQRMIDVAVLKE